ncbi:MAG: D-alanine--D-alanine ligase [Pseudomonadota bacterium]
MCPAKLELPPLNPTSFGRVAVLLGGDSRERDISLMTGQAVVDSLRRSGVNVTAFELRHFNAMLIDQLRHFDYVFIALHGAVGEDGSLQGLLECMKIKYTGSGVAACALAMNKGLAKKIWQQLALPTPHFWEIKGLGQLAAFLESARQGDLVYPLAVKPASEGSSLGMTKVKSFDELEPALQRALYYDSQILIEQWVDGTEYTVGVMAGKALPSIRIEVSGEFYDYNAKYVSDSTKFHLPSGLNPDQELQIGELALRAFEALGCAGWGRVDVMMDHQGQFYIIEVNTVPGMTQRSLVPKAAKVVGLEFDELVLNILNTARDKGVLHRSVENTSSST